ncbi:MAG: TlpA family protein disulfide reductase [Sandaracinaceae bacterium]
MDRLSTVALLALGALVALTACDDGVAPVSAPGRVVAVQATAEAPRAFCDVEFSAAEGQPLTWPTLSDGQSVPAATGPRWLNVWATWCHPCVDELPRLAEWESQLAAQDAPIQLAFLSADADAETVASFRETHTEAPDSLRMADPAELAEWVGQLGLDAGASLPIHVITDARGRVRCLRAGAVSEDDYPAVRSVIHAL